MKHQHKIVVFSSKLAVTISLAAFQDKWSIFTETCFFATHVYVRRSLLICLFSKLQNSMITFMFMFMIDFNECLLGFLAASSWKWDMQWFCSSFLLSGWTLYKWNHLKSNDQQFCALFLCICTHNSLRYVAFVLEVFENIRYSLLLAQNNSLHIIFSFILYYHEKAKKYSNQMKYHIFGINFIDRNYNPLRMIKTELINRLLKSFFCLFLCFRFQILNLCSSQQASIWSLTLSCWLRHQWYWLVA